MVTASTARKIVGIVGNVISFFLFASPMYGGDILDNHDASFFFFSLLFGPTFGKIYKNRSVEEFKPDPYLATIINCLLWILYGLPFVTPDSVLVVTVNGVGLAMEVVYITIFFTFAPKKGRLKVIAWIITELLFLGIVATCILLLAHTHEKRSRIVGILCVIFGGLMYAAPLTIMKKVIATKSVKYMPFYLSLTNFLNGVVWVSYALIHFDLYILIGNGLGALFGAIQLVLYACYQKSTPKDEEKKPSEVQLPRYNLSII